MGLAGCLHTSPGRCCWCYGSVRGSSQKFSASRHTLPSCMPLSAQVSIHSCAPHTDKPTYLKEMDKYHAMNCSSASGDRPLVK